jgi:hypothetical protein
MKLKLFISCAIVFVLNFILFAFILANVNLVSWSIGTRLTFAFTTILLIAIVTVIISISDDVSLMDDDYDI